MLSKETKDKIYNARSILVGQLPLPSDQIELITIALIYKFMDDIDEESRKLGGEISFFRNGLGDYSWQKLLSNQLSGEERVQKFIHAIEAITKAPHIPELFKSIFRNTFLKFRDSRTLKLFLDEINKFKYEHSEELGNAFEYLLDSMGSQGENGQFRTPRNIIDFIVEVVDPDKDDKILDPACGTAGFLISAYKHILRKYTKGYEDYRISLNNYEIEGISIHWGDKLKVTEKDKLTKRIEGYDITPLMVRLSQVNMYLHHFPNPLIHDYDTLSTKSRWDDKYDCIFANPPFMTPKGGVEPHEQFRIRASKAEILFSDYIIEHLTPNGKAGWIVPEGIIFQGSGDYVTLRKWLTENMGLWAVVSLPANIFQPYSGVKTSILFVDRTLARLTDQIILVKVENDGFSLNTNRNPIKENDLPSALNLLIDYKKLLPAVSSKSNESEQKVLEFSDKYKIKFKLLTRKEIAALDSYKAVSSTIDFCKREYKSFLKAKEKYEESYQKAKDEKQKQKVLETFHKNQKHFIDVTGFDTIPFDEGMIKQWVNEKLKDDAVKYGEDRSNIVQLSSELCKYLDNQRDFILSVEPQLKGITTDLSNYEMLSLSDICKFINGRAFKPTEWEEKRNGTLPIIRIQNLNDDSASYNYYSKEVSEQYYVNFGDLLFSWSGSKGTSFGPHIWNGNKAILNQHIFRVEYNNSAIKEYLYWALKRLVGTVEENLHGGVGLVHITKGNLEKLKIPVPPLDIQQKIVDEIDGYQKVIDGCNLVIKNYKPSFKFDESWECCHLKDIAEIISGYGFNSQDFSMNGKIKSIKITNVGVGEFVETDNECLPDDYLNKFANYIVYENDIVMALTRPLISSGLKVCIVPNSYDKSLLNQRVAAVRGRQDISLTKYIFYYLCNKTTLSYVKQKSRSLNQPNLSINDFGDFEIFLPPIDEQQKIIDTVGEELKVVENCKHLKIQMEQKIKEVIDGVWGKSTN
jgi:type I restriction enzyme M protein